MNLEIAIAQTEAAVARVDAAFEDGRPAEVLDLVEEAIGIALFQIRPGKDGPYHFADFGGGVPEPPEGPMFPALQGIRDGATEELAVLVDAIEALQAVLIWEANCSEFTDANLNSRQYLRAAGHLDLAAEKLALLISDQDGGTGPPSSRPTPGPA